MEAKGKVILFGKTGAGKSTVANALTTGTVGGTERLKFPVHSGPRGYTGHIQKDTGNGWTVVDTIGLGEGERGRVESNEAEDRILRFLQEVKGEYSHIIYVKNATERIESIDEQIWSIFKRVFRGAEKSFVILFTHASPTFVDDNYDNLPEWCKEQKMFVTNLPSLEPMPDRPVQERRNKAIVDESISKLSDDLVHYFTARGATYGKPSIAGMDPSALITECKALLQWLKQFFGEMTSRASASIQDITRRIADPYANSIKETAAAVRMAATVVYNYFNV